MHVNQSSLTVQNGASPVYAASSTGATEVLGVLIRAGADVNQALTKVQSVVLEKVLLHLGNYFLSVSLNVCADLCDQSISRHSIYTQGWHEFIN